MLGEAAATVDFVLDPDTTAKGGDFVVSSDCYSENRTMFQMPPEFLPISQLEVYVLLILILVFLCSLMKRRFISNLLNQRHTIGSRRAVV